MVSLWAAALLPGLIAYNLPPSPTRFNQAAALGLWGLAIVALAPACEQRVRVSAMHTATLNAGLLLAAAVGFEFHRQAAASHEIGFNPETRRHTTIPNHSGDMPEGTLRASAFCSGTGRAG